MAKEYGDIDPISGDIYAGDHTLQRTNRVGELLSRRRVQDLIPGRRFDGDTQSLTDLRLVDQEPSDRRLKLEQWTIVRPEDDSKGF